MMTGFVPLKQVGTTNPQRSEFYSIVANDTQNARAASSVSSSKPEHPRAFDRLSTSATTSESLNFIAIRPSFLTDRCVSRLHDGCGGLPMVARRQRRPFKGPDELNGPVRHGTEHLLSP